jgi:uncharacterized membrane protein YcfT
MRAPHFAHVYDRVRVGTEQERRMEQGRQADEATREASAKPARIDWLDHARGVCIILVVMLYATEMAADRAGHEGWLHEVARFAKPFRMPDFFMLSGLLLPLVIRRDWRLYLDRKVVHFVWFYALWLTILFAFRFQHEVSKAGVGGAIVNYFVSYVEPYSMLWFIYLLPIFFVTTKLLRRAPPALIWVAAAALQVWQPDTGVKVIEKFTAYYVFFFSGYWLSGHLLRVVPKFVAHHAVAAVALGTWAAVNGYLVFSGRSTWPGLNLALALAGCLAVMVFACWVSRARAFRWLQYCGEHSIVIYLAFLIPLVISRKVLSMAGIADVGWLSLLSTAASVAGALCLYWLVRGTRLAFLFKRPAWFGIVRDRAPAGDARDARSGAAAS